MNLYGQSWDIMGISYPSTQIQVMIRLKASRSARLESSNRQSAVRSEAPSSLREGKSAPEGDPTISNGPHSFSFFLMRTLKEQLSVLRRNTDPGDRSGTRGKGNGVRRSVSRVLSTPPRGTTLDGHSSATPVAGRLARPTRTGRGNASRVVPRQRRGPAVPIRSCSRWGLPCRPRCRGRGALLPHPFTLAAPGACPGPIRPEGRGYPGAGRAVCSLWHFPGGRPRRTLSGTVFPWSPDFPQHRRFPRMTPRPSDRLTRPLFRPSPRERQSRRRPAFGYHRRRQRHWPEQRLR